MKLKTIMESKEALDSLLKKSLPISIAWELKKFTKTVNPELEIFLELKNKTIVEMGEEIIIDGSPTGQNKVKDENLIEYYKIINELIDKEIDIKIPKIKISDLLEYRDIKNKPIEISTEELMILDWLIIE